MGSTASERIGILVSGMIQLGLLPTIRIRKGFDEIGLSVEVVEGSEVAEVWKITTEDFRVIQVLEFSFILMF